MSNDQEDAKAQVNKIMGDIAEGLGNAVQGTLTRLQVKATPSLTLYVAGVLFRIGCRMVVSNGVDVERWLRVVEGTMQVEFGQGQETPTVTTKDGKPLIVLA